MARMAGQILRATDRDQATIVTEPANRSSELTVEGRSTVAWMNYSAKLWWTTSA